MGPGYGYGAKIVISQCPGKMSGFNSQQGGEIIFLLPGPAQETTQPSSSSNTFGSYLGVCVAQILAGILPFVIFLGSSRDAGLIPKNRS